MTRTKSLSGSTLRTRLLPLSAYRGFRGCPPTLVGDFRATKPNSPAAEDAMVPRCLRELVRYDDARHGSRGVTQATQFPERMLLPDTLSLDQSIGRVLSPFSGVDPYSEAQAFEQTIFAAPRNREGSPIAPWAETPLSRRVHHHMRASFCTAKCDISPSPKDRTVRCGGSKTAVMMLRFCG